MSMIEIEIRGLLEAQLKFGRDVLDAIEPAIERATARMEGEMKRYPPRIPDGYWAQHTTPRQRRFFFWALRRGVIKGNRMGTLGRSWTRRVFRSGDELTGEVGNIRPYAPWVQSYAMQARMHRGRWVTDEAVMEDELPRLVADVETELRRTFG
jgi:hypothetical protein